MPLDSPSKVRCGVIGAGWWGTFAHIPALLEDPRAELLAIQTLNEGQALKVAKDFGIPRAYTSADELLSKENLDAVIVASSPNMHYEHARAALRKGLNVLVEKPMTFTVAQAEELVSLADQNGKQLIISCPWHYTRYGREARRRILGGDLGETRMISVLMTNPVAHMIRGDSSVPTHGKPYTQPQGTTYSDPQVAGGGQIYTQVSHAAAYLTYLTDARPAQVFARFHNDGSRMDIYDTINIELENGCLVSLASTGATALDQRDYEVRVYGTRGILFLELWRGSMRLVPLDGSKPENFPDLPANEVYPERAPGRNLVDVVVDSSANVSPGTLGLAAMEVIESARVSARTGENVTIRPSRRISA